MHEKTRGTDLPSVLALAYLGDAAHQLYVRKMLVARGISKSGDLNRASLAYITAEAQAQMYKSVEHLLLDDERDVYRRAYNSSHLSKPKRASHADYRCATGFEAVIGMLYWLGDDERMDLLLETGHKEIENDTEN